MWCVAPLEMNEGNSFGGKGTIGLQAAVLKRPHTRTLTFLVQTVYARSKQVLRRYVCFRIKECKVNLQAHLPSMMVSLTGFAVI